VHETFHILLSNPRFYGRFFVIRTVNTRYLLDHEPPVRPRQRQPMFVNRGDTRWDFLGVGPHHLQSLPRYAPSSGIRRFASSPRSKSSSWKTKEAMISGAPPRVGTMRRPIYTPSATDNTVKQYMSQVVGGGSRRRDGWATRGVCLCVRRPRVRSTPRFGTFGVNLHRLQHRYAAISRAQATAAAAAYIKDGLKFLCFALNTVGYAVK
jgi:hypothetical protein